MKILKSIGNIFFVLAFSAGTSWSQERNLPEEIRALSAICSTGADIKFKGEIEGGINKLLGRVLSGSGDLEISKNENEFLGSFEDPNLRLEAKKIFNDCIINTLQIVYNFRKEEKTKFSVTRSKLLVPDALQVIRSGQTFALRNQESISLEKGGVFAINRTRHKGLTPVGIINGKDRNTFPQFRMGERAGVSGTGCAITFYARRQIKNSEFIYSFKYDC